MNRLPDWTMGPLGFMTGALLIPGVWVLLIVTVLR